MCEECEDKFPTAQELEWHAKEKQHQAWICKHPSCGVRFKNRSAFSVHRSTHKAQERDPKTGHPCQGCGHLFPRKHNLVEHLKLNRCRRAGFHSASAGKSEVYTQYVPLHTGNPTQHGIHGTSVPPGLYDVPGSAITPLDTTTADQSTFISDSTPATAVTSPDVDLTASASDDDHADTIFSRHDAFTSKDGSQAVLTMESTDRRTIPTKRKISAMLDMEIESAFSKYSGANERFGVFTVPGYNHAPLQPEQYHYQVESTQNKQPQGHQSQLQMFNNAQKVRRLQISILPPLCRPNSNHPACKIPRSDRYSQVSLAELAAQVNSHGKLGTVFLHLTSH